MLGGQPKGKGSAKAADEEVRPSKARFWLKSMAWARFRRNAIRCRPFERIVASARAISWRARPRREFEDRRRGHPLISGDSCMSKMVAVLTAAFCFPTIGFAAETYCQAPGLRLYDGADLTTEWTVTNVQGRKIQRIGQQRPTRGCIRDFYLGGMLLSSEIITPAKLGTFRVLNKYRIYYESEKLGFDEVAYKTTWEAAGRIKSAIVRVKIHVVSGAI